jgi:hypothetical protein
VVCDIPSYRLRRKLPWLPHLVTVWHRDPERDGGDDSCDWFGGKRCPQKTLDEITRTFLFEGRDGGAMSWFGDKKYSPDLIGVGLCMFRVAANHHFGHWSRKAGRFLGRNLFDILHFIDNGCDSINEAIGRGQGAGRHPQETGPRRLRLDPAPPAPLVATPALARLALAAAGPPRPDAQALAVQPLRRVRQGVFLGLLPGVRRLERHGAALVPQRAARLPSRVRQANVRHERP